MSKSHNEDVRVGVGIIVTRGDEVLLLRRRNFHGEGTWSTPGGHMEFGESPEQCAIRETREETGLTVRDVQFKTITNDVFRDEGKHYITIWMEAAYAGGEPRPEAAYEASAIGWFRWDALPKPLFLSLQNLIDAAGTPPCAISSR